MLYFIVLVYPILHVAFNAIMTSNFQRGWGRGRVSVTLACVH